MNNAQLMTIPEVHSFEQIIKRAEEKSSVRPPRAVLIDDSDADMVKAFEKATAAKLIEPVALADADDPGKTVMAAIGMAVGDKIDLIIKGGFPHIGFLKILVGRDHSFVQKGKLISHVGVFEAERYSKLLLVTDAGVTVQPDLKQKLVLVQNAVEFAGRIGIEMPRVAFLAAVEIIYPQMPVTTDAAIAAKMSDRKQIRGCYVDGPLSFDVAVDMAAAHSKGIRDSEVAGQADILIAPTIETAHGIYTAMSLYSKAMVGGVIVGGRVPVAIASRSDSMDNKYRSIVLSALAS